MENGGEVNFSFTVNDYELGAQTAGPNAEMLANSGKGQHIHFILNNQPYSAHYEPAFTKEIPDGVHHLVAFLSRSYHESVKNANSVVVKKLEVGANATDSLGLDMEAPTLIYSRPKGTYAGADAKNLLLDFFVLNTTLSADGNKVKATINGEEFMIYGMGSSCGKRIAYGRGYHSIGTRRCRRQWDCRTLQSSHPNGYSKRIIRGSYPIRIKKSSCFSWIFFVAKK